MDDKTTRANRRPESLTELNWDQLDKTKFNVLGAGMFTAVSAMLYPIVVVKTRLQVAPPDAVERNAYSVIKGLLKSEGILGLYRGFRTVSIGSLPARVLFITTLEKAKEASFKMTEHSSLSPPTQAAVANGVAGVLASACSQVIFVPMDVVSQKMMVQGYSGHETYGGGMDVIRKIIKSEGIRGMYRGFGLSVMTYAPSNGVWWACYGSSQRMIWRLLDRDTESSKTAPSELKVFLVQASGGVLAGGAASCVSTPMDTLKTRLQVAGHGKKPSIKQVTRNLIAEDGWTGLYRGLGARFLSTTAWGTSLVLCYEYLKRICPVE